MKKRFSEQQNMGFLGEVEAELSIKDLCRRHGFSEASYYIMAQRGRRDCPSGAWALTLISSLAQTITNDHMS